MTYTVIIPARHASTRLPGKPLLEIAGKPMIQWVWERARRSSAERVIIATDHPGIAEACAGFGATACMTAAEHPSGTDRLQEVVRQLELPDEDVVVNVQGDEPLIPPDVIEQVAANLAAQERASIATLCEPIGDAQELLNPNAVKVVIDEAGMALYFSRAPIPWPRDAFADGARVLPAGGHWRRHIGIYAYRAGFLHRFVSWPPAPLERLESLEQLRALYHGEGIHVAAAAAPVPAGVDTPEDLEAVRRHLASAPPPAQ